MNFLFLPEAKQDIEQLPAPAHRDFVIHLREADRYGRLAGQRLDSKPGTECLQSWRKHYFGFGSSYRIVFQQSGNCVRIIAVGPRRGNNVYERAAERIEAHA